MYLYRWGLGANNPSGIAVIEGITKCGWNKDEIKLLSIGCTHTPYQIDVLGATKKGIKIISPDKMLETFMEIESQYSEGMAKLLLDNSRYIRINPEQQYNRFELDNASHEKINELIGLGNAEARYKCKDIIDEFFNDKAEPFEPVCKL